MKARVMVGATVALNVAVIAVAVIVGVGDSHENDVYATRMADRNRTAIAGCGAMVYNRPCTSHVDGLTATVVKVATPDGARFRITWS